MTIKVPEKLLQINGPENYLGSVNLNGENFNVFKTEDNSSQIEVTAFTDSGKIAAFYRGTRKSKKYNENPKNFLNLPKNTYRKIVLTEILTREEHRKKGLSKILKKEMSKLLTEKKLVEVGGFTDKGYKFLFKKGLYSGYTSCKITSRRNMAEHFQNLTNWIYKDYSR